jgi:hypothetical protein
LPRIQYQEINLGARKLAAIKQANVIIAEYQEQGFNAALERQKTARGLLSGVSKKWDKVVEGLNGGGDD